MHLLAFAETIQLFPDGTIFIHIALIVLMIWVLNRTYFKPINRVIEARELQKGGQGGEAESILRAADEKEAAYRQAITDARTKGYELVEAKHAAAVTERDMKLKSAKSEIAARVAAEKAELERQAAEARATIAADADKLAEKITSNILKA
jgi:F-type H+-transporting ATPase subunit b